MNTQDINEYCIVNGYHNIEEAERYNVVNYGDVYSLFTAYSVSMEPTLVNSKAIPVEFIDVFSKGTLVYPISGTSTEIRFGSIDTPWFLNDITNKVIVFPDNRFSALKMTEACTHRFEITENDFYKQHALVLQKIGKFSRLKENWDSYGAKPIDKECIDKSLKIIEELIKLKSTESFDIPNPFIAPLSSGGIQIEWERDERYLEINISSNASIVDFYTTDNTKGGQLSLEGSLKSVSFISELIAWFVNGKAEDLPKISFDLDLEALA